MLIIIIIINNITNYIFCHTLDKIITLFDFKNIINNIKNYLIFWCTLDNNKLFKHNIKL